jgi:hypothetical protein
VPNDGDEYRQRSQAINAGVLAVGDHGIGADLLADPDLHDRDQFVADKADDGGGCDPGQIGQWLRINQLLERLNQNVSGAEANRDHNQDTGDVFRPAEAIGIAAGGGPARQVKRDQQRNRVERIAQVVDRIGQQRDTATGCR